jgi:hypothetical protein
VIFPNSFTNYSGVSFSHDGTHILCFSRNGIHILRRDGTFACTVSGEGSKPGFFRGEGQIFKLSEKNKFAISDIENNRIQIVEIDFQTGSMKVLNIIGTNCFFKPLGIVEMGNCIVAFSYDNGCAYVWDGERNFQVLDGKFVGARFACKLPDGRIAICNKTASVVQIIQENYNVPAGMDCLDVAFRENRKKYLTNVDDSEVQTSVPMTQVADSEVQTSVPMTQVADSGVQTSVPMTQVADSGVQTSVPMTHVADSGVQTSVPMTHVADSGVQTNSPTESFFTRLFQYLYGYLYL